LGGHSACTIGVVLVPTQLGSQTGVLTISDALRTQTVTLSGAGVQPAMLRATPTGLTFASQNLGVASAPSILTIANTGAVAAANVGFGITGAAAGSFSTGTITCTASLVPGASCTVQVIFSPATAGGIAAALTISSSTLGVTPVTVPLNGVGHAAAGLNVSPAQLSFTATVVGSSSVAQMVTIGNTSSVSASQLTLTPTAGFALTQNTCTASLIAGAVCTVGVIFTPTATGAVTGTLNVSSISVATQANVTLSGSGANASAILVTPATIAFAMTGAGQTSSATTVTVANSGTATTLNNLVLTVPAGFMLVNNTCAASLGPGVSCTVGVVFAPTVAGAQTGNLTVSSSTLQAGASVSLNGMGFDFTVTASGSSTQSAASGQNALYTLVLTPLSGSSGVFIFACDALPADALCTFNPTTETLSSGVIGNLTVQVSTGSSSAASRLKGPGPWGILPLVCGLLFPIGWRRRRKLLDLVVLLMLVVILSGGIAGCAKSGGGTGGGGGGGGSGGGSGFTRPGTYSIPVTVTSTGVSHSATLTLTVD
jgi:hypothetical protein